MAKEEHSPHSLLQESSTNGSQPSAQVIANSSGKISSDGPNDLSSAARASESNVVGEASGALPGHNEDDVSSRESAASPSAPSAAQAAEGGKARSEQPGAKEIGASNVRESPSANHELVTETRQRRRSIPWLVVGLGLLGVMISVVLLPLMSVVFRGKAALARAIAETDALDPAWRWEDMVAQLPDIPPAENGWFVLEEFYNRYYLSVIYPWRSSLQEHWRSNQWSVNRRPPERILADLERLEASLNPEGLHLLLTLLQYEHVWPPYLMRSTANPNAWPQFNLHCLEIALFTLSDLEKLYAAKGRISELERSLHLHCKLSRALAKMHHLHSTAFSWLNGYPFRVFWCLGHAELSEATLHHLQLQAEQMAETNWPLEHIRACRAFAHCLFTNLEKDPQAWSAWKREWQSYRSRSFDEFLFNTYIGGWEHLKSEITSFAERRTAAFLLYAHHADVLRLLNEQYTAYNRSYEEIIATHNFSRDQYQSDLWNAQTKWAAHLLPTRQVLNRCWPESYVRLRLHLDLLKVALASERYRLKSKNWPSQLEDLVPEFVSQIPYDPFDYPNRLRLVRRPDGITIYSVGRDRTDNGGQKQDDIGVALFDPKDRNVAP